MKYLKKFEGYEDICKDIAKEILPELKRLKSKKGYYSYEDFEEYMKGKKAANSIISATADYLREMGFSFDNESSNTDDEISTIFAGYDETSYSSDPKDWYFDISEFELMGDEPTKVIALSQDPAIMDDQLGAHNLPKVIKVLLAPYFFMGSELQESTFEENPNNTLTVDELIKKMISFGFKKN